ncbi:MAG: sodium-dependent transporter [Deferribacteres bacterium]|nr:sodium-dependent transporter [candidate division KSB1 bacterium]MCB9501166.1 sodium-dependent transporter [Deferribacteres bacterium]
MNQARGEWSSRFGFILAAAGSAIGLGNIWGFPIMTAKNGGAAFVLVYLLLTFIVCFPVVMTEIAIGRRTAKNPVGAFKELAPNSQWFLVGGLGITGGFMILSFYVVIAGWVFGYFIEVLAGGLDRLAMDGEFTNFVANPWKNLIYTGLFMLATIGIVVGGIKDGIERWARLLMPALLFMLLALIIYVMTLENAGRGLAFYLIPNFSKITIPVINSALSQAFFSLSLGMGALITYGSYVSRKDDIISSGFIVTVFDSSIAFLAGLLIIPAIFTLAPDTTSETIQAGPGLIFVFLPKVFMNLSNDVGYFFASFLAAFFFLLISFAALTSTISLLEVPTSYVVDERKIVRKKAAITVGIVIFIISIGSILANGASEFFTNFITYPSGVQKDFLSFIADVFFEMLLPLGGFLLTAFAAFRWKTHNLSKEISVGREGYSGSLLDKWISFMIYICPFIIFFIFMNTVLEKFFNIVLF